MKCQHNLEQTQPGVKINLFIEACYSGSFIRPPASVSKAGRVVVTSAQYNRLARASDKGAYFSDLLIDSLGRKESLFNSFRTAYDGANIANPNQEPLLDANGNGLPNEPADYQAAAQIGFGFAGTLDEPWPPYIMTVTGSTEIKQGAGIIRAEIQDDKKVQRAWAFVYPPSYQPPAQVGNEMIKETLPALYLHDQGNGNWAVTYPAFTESGTYRLVVYVEDNSDLQARPRELTVTIGGAKIYLPLIVK